MFGRETWRRWAFGLGSLATGIGAEGIWGPGILPFPLVALYVLAVVPGAIRLVAGKRSQSLGVWPRRALLAAGLFLILSALGAMGAIVLGSGNQFWPAWLIGGVVLLGLAGLGWRQAIRSS